MKQDPPLNLESAPIRTTILVVDDQPDNIRVLSSLLVSQGYKVRKATSGLLALETVQAEPPDLILLDINMPSMNGFQVCQQLKASEQTRSIPVIFLSALSDSVEKVQAFQFGGVDYITKPFQTEEVLVRIENQITLHQQQQQLKLQNERLQQEIAERQRVEDLLRQAEAKYRSIFENATEGIFQATAGGQYLCANPALAKILGYASAEELMSSLTQIGRQLYVQPKRREELIAFLNQYEQVSGMESEVYRKDGKKIWIVENMQRVCDETGRLLYYEGTVQDITSRRKMEMELRYQRQQADRLLVNILPPKIAQRLKTHPGAIAASFEDVTVLFADLVGFSMASAQISPVQLVELLNQIFSAFDQLAETNELEKIKTIGDAYMVVAGLPTPRVDHAGAIARMALDMQRIIPQFYKPDGTPFQLRIGINTGPVVAGVIGIKKFTYDLWGDTVNIASRMEMLGEPGRIQVTATTYECLQAQFNLQERGTIFVKGRGEMLTYWLESEKPEEEQVSDLTCLLNLSSG
jgi:PAS domain S-box-containing protein